MTRPSAPASPCVNVCALDSEGKCTGCRRTIDEITRWGRMSGAEQWQVIARLERERGSGAQDAPRARTSASAADAR